MGRPQAAVQAQVQHQTNISHTESLELVRCLLRVSIFHVSYLRGLFPEKSFKGVDMKNLDDMHIKMLLPSCDESRRLIDWVEGGVYDAIKRSYLKNLFFGISTDPLGTELLEEYVFTFRYGDDGRVAMDVNAITSDNGGEGGGKKRGKKGEFKQDGKADLNTVRYQVCRLIRMLVQVCRTLDKVPAERYLFMKLTYQDHTPDEYEPPYFIPVDENGVGHFKRAPFSMAVGRVATDHHTVSLKVKSTLDSCDDELMDGDGSGETAEVDAHRSGGDGRNGPAATDRVTAQAQPSEGSNGSGDVGTEDEAMTAEQRVAAGPGGPGGDAMAGVEDDDLGAGTPSGIEPTAAPLPEVDGPGGNPDVNVGSQDVAAAAPQVQEHLHLHLQPPPPPPSPADQASTGGAEGGGDVDMDLERGDAGAGVEDDVTEAPEAEDYVAVCEYIRGRSQINMAQMARQFSAMSQGALGAYMGRLKDQGVLVAVPGAHNRFRVVAEPSSALSHPPAAKQLEAQSAPLSGDPGARAGGVADPDAETAAAAGTGAIGKQVPGKQRAQRHEAEDAAAAITKHMDGLSMGMTRGGSACGRAAVDNTTMADDLLGPRDQTERADCSRGGRLESAPAGDELTDMVDVEGENNKCPAGDAGGKQLAQPDGELHVYIVGSQQSGLERLRGGRVRKASYVADPIQQGGAASKKAKTGPAAAGKPGPSAAGCTLTRPGGGMATAGDKADKTAAPTPRGTRGGSRLSNMRR